MLRIVDTNANQCSTRVKFNTKLTAGQKVCKKYKRAMMKKIQRQELRKLRSIIPSVAQKKVSKVEVVEEAIRYISYLEQTLLQKLEQNPEMASFAMDPRLLETLRMQSACCLDDY